MKLDTFPEAQIAQDFARLSVTDLKVRDWLACGLVQSLLCPECSS